MQISILQGFSYVCLLVFFVKTVMIWRRYSGMPRHLRWELHPTPREEALHDRGIKERGGIKGFLFELSYMAREILLFQGCFQSNRSLWYATYPFHLGVFLTILWFALLFLSVPFTYLDLRLLTGILDKTMVFCGALGFILGTVGCAGLLKKRIFDLGLSTYTSLREYLNLYAILLVFSLNLVVWLTMDNNFALSRAYVHSLFSLSPPPEAHWLFRTAVVITSAFIAFLPFGSLRHGMAKFFTYHRVRWDDERNIRGSQLEAIIQLQLNRPMTWGAPHVQCSKWGNVGNMGKTEREEPL